jgi:hypothetical protein
MIRHPERSLISKICFRFHSPAQEIMNNRIAIIIITLLLTAQSVTPIDIPGIYLCKAVRLTQVKRGRTYSKGFQVQQLYLKFTPREVRAFGTHSKIDVCRSLAIRYYSRDTVYLEDPELPFGHSELKLYMVDDTIMGNVNLFDNDTSEVSVKVIVKKLPFLQDRELEQLCQ